MLKKTLWRELKVVFFCKTYLIMKLALVNLFNLFSLCRWIILCRHRLTGLALCHYVGGLASCLIPHFCQHCSLSAFSRLTGRVHNQNLGSSTSCCIGEIQTLVSKSATTRIWFMSPSSDHFQRT